MKKRMNYNLVEEIDIKDDDPKAATKKVEPRADFNKSTIIELYKSVGGFCSKCKRITIARNPKTKKYVSIGEAAHIFGAKRSKKSPRSNDEMTREELKSFENGIWLCRNCHRQVDYDFPSFDSDKLIEMKKKAEKHAYDLINKNIDDIVLINYDEFDIYIFNKFQQCLLHYELVNEGIVSFDLTDYSYTEFIQGLFNEKKYVKHIPFKMGDKQQNTSFRWDDCWDIFMRLDIGNVYENSYSLNWININLLIYKEYAFLLEKPKIEEEIKMIIEKNLSKDNNGPNISFDDLSNYEDELIIISNKFIKILEKQITS